MPAVRSYARYWKGLEVYSLDSAPSQSKSDGGSVQPADYDQVPVLTKRLHLLKSLSCKITVTRETFCHHAKLIGNLLCQPR